MFRLWAVLTCFVSVTAYCQKDPCDLKRDIDGIKVYTCKTGNEKFKLLRAEFELSNVSMSQLKSFIWNVPNYINWQYNMIESELISTEDDNNITYRSLVHAPWPVENRELVLKVKMEEGQTATSIFIRSFEYARPIPPDVVRVPFFDASWKIIHEEKNLKVTYTLRIDPGGSVPAWLANLAMAEGPFISFKKLKYQIENPGK